MAALRRVGLCGAMETSKTRGESNSPPLHCRSPTSIAAIRSRGPVAPQAIFGPFFATIFLTLIVWVYMYVRRIHFIAGHKISPNDLAVPGALARLTPPAVSNPSDNL